MIGTLNLEGKTFTTVKRDGQEQTQTPQKHLSLNNVSAILQHEKVNSVLYVLYKRHSIFHLGLVIIIPSDFLLSS